MNIFVVTIYLLALALCLYLAFWTGIAKGLVSIINACKMPETPAGKIAIGLGRIILGFVALWFTGIGSIFGFGIMLQLLKG